MADPPTAEPVLAQIAAAVQTTARGVSGGWWYVGWTAERLPAATTALEGLSEDTRRDLDAYHGARLAPRRLPYATLSPVAHVLTGSAIDFADTPYRRAEDQVMYTVIDATGQRRDVAVGEMAVLGAIVAAREPWQSHGGAPMGEMAVNAIPFYTLFTPLPGQRADHGLAMLFEATLPGGSNAPAFHAFVRHTIGRLLVLDESQPAASRKGYLEVAGRMAGTPPKGGVAGTLVWLRRAGLVDFDDPWLQTFRRRGQQTRGVLIRALRGLGMVEVDDALLDELSDPRPDYDVDRLELDQLFAMASEMYDVARRVIGG